MNATSRVAIVIVSLIGANAAGRGAEAVAPLGAAPMVGSTGDPAGSVGLALWASLDGITLPEPEPGCFDTTVAAAGPATHDALAQLVDDPFSLWGMEIDTRRQFVGAYVRCAAFDSVMFILAANVINSFESTTCIVEAWTGVLSIDALVSTLSFGGGLDDLSPAVVQGLVAGVTFCMPQPAWTQWWVDDIAIEIGDRHDVTVAQATCVATNFVQRLGLARAVERRVLTIPVLALPDADLGVVDLPGCGVSLTFPPLTPGVVGDCLLQVETAQQLSVVPCDAAHHREIIAIVDVSTVMPAWPGTEALLAHAADSCSAIAETALAGRDVAIMLWWWPPTRVAWERNGRSIVCAVGSPDNAAWTTPFSAIAPSISTPTTTTAGQK